MEGISRGKGRLGRTPAVFPSPPTMALLRSQLVAPGAAAAPHAKRLPLISRAPEPLQGSGGFGGPCRSVLRVDDARDVAQLDHCAIRLGQCPRLVEDSCGLSYDSAGNPLPWGEYYLEASVPARFDGLAGFEEMLRAYVPDWYETVCGTSTWLDRAAVSLRPLDARLVFGGKNWSSDVYGNALVLAIAQVQAYARLAEGPEMFSGPCGLTEHKIKDTFRWGFAPITALACGMDGFREPCAGSVELVSSSLTVDASGQLTAEVDMGDTEFLALTSLGGIYLHPRYLVNAATADYYFWWARRLLAAAASSGGTLQQSLIGYLCARAAIAELSGIAEVIVHELGHLIGGVTFHCGFPPISKANCCNSISQIFYFHRMAAEIGHPPPHMPWGNREDKSNRRYYFGFGGTLDEAFDECGRPGRGGGAREEQAWAQAEVWDYFHSGDGCAGAFQGCNFRFTARHCEWMTGPHRLELYWEFRDSEEDEPKSDADWRECDARADLCVRASDAVTGSVVYNEGADAC